MTVAIHGHGSHLGHGIDWKPARSYVLVSTEEDARDISGKSFRASMYGVKIMVTMAAAHCSMSFQA